MKKILAGIAILAVAAAAQADLLAQWNFTGSNSTAWGAGPHSATGENLGANMSSATLTAVNMTPSAGGNSLRFTGTTWGGVRDESELANSTSYVQVSLRANDTYTMTVDSIDMLTIGSGTGMNGTAVWTDANGTPVTASWTTANTGTSTPAPHALTTPLSGSSVELRLYATTTVGTGTYGFNGGTGTNQSLRINGTTTGPTAVPEPATMSLLGLGALAMVIRRKLSK
ncbi:MAG: PEP-CTERM sorting domain-containing protein [Kiritimatiellae bacterium]|nr:PEP-CTERM sorting domain-containing protein [Kiritimatiellia bacterium]